MIMHFRYVLAGCCLAFSVLSDASDRSTATIDSSGTGYSGTLMLNQAAGDLQQQVNAGAIAPSSMPTIRVEQHRIEASAASATGAMQAGIHGDAFSGGNGVLGINQSAGVANQQINGFRLGAGVRPESLDDSSLAQSTALSSLSSAAGSREAGDRLVEIDNQAFTDSRGVVQLNQAAGVGNRMVNNLGIRIME